MLSTGRPKNLHANNEETMSIATIKSHLLEMKTLLDKFQIELTETKDEDEEPQKHKIHILAAAPDSIFMNEFRKGMEDSYTTESFDFLLALNQVYIKIDSIIENLNNEPISPHEIAIIIDLDLREIVKKHVGTKSSASPEISEFKPSIFKISKSRTMFIDKSNMQAPLRNSFSNNATPNRISVSENIPPEQNSRPSTPSRRSTHSSGEPSTPISIAKPSWLKCGAGVDATQVNLPAKIYKKIVSKYNSTERFTLEDFTTKIASADSGSSPIGNIIGLVIDDLSLALRNTLFKAYKKDHEINEILAHLNEYKENRKQVNKPKISFLHRKNSLDISDKHVDEMITECKKILNDYRNSSAELNLKTKRLRHLMTHYRKDDEAERVKIRKEIEQTFPLQQLEVSLLVVRKKYISIFDDVMAKPRRWFKKSLKVKSLSKSESTAKKAEQKLRIISNLKAIIEEPSSGEEPSRKDTPTSTTPPSSASTSANKGL